LITATAVTLPLLTWMVVITMALRVSLIDTAGAVAFRIYYVILAVVLTGWSVLRLREGDYRTALISLGAVCLLIEGMLWYGFRFSGTVGIGPGEEFSSYDSVQAGPWARQNPIPLFVDVLPDGSQPSITVLLDGQRSVIALQEKINWKDYRIQAEGVHRAPLFVLMNKRGDELEGGYFKLRLQNHKPEFIQFPTIPHRLYVASPENKLIRWRRRNAGWERSDESGKNDAITSPDSLMLKIIRGKLTLYNGMINKDEDVEFDGYAIRYADEARWVSFRVERRPQVFALFVGIAMILSGAMITSFRGKRRD